MCLVLDSCKLESVSNEILSLKKLTHLSLKNNKISAIQEEILSLGNLTHLFLNDNYIKVIPEKINMLEKLIQLNVSDNLISAVPEEIIKNMKYLQMFKIGFNPLKKMTSLLWDLPGVDELDLRKIKDIPVKNNDLDMSVMINSKTKIPDKISTVQIFYNVTNNKLSSEIMDDIPSFVDNLIIICAGPVRLDNLPPSLKKLLFISYRYTKFEWITEYLEKKYIKLPFECEISYKLDYKYAKLYNQV